MKDLLSLFASATAMTSSDYRHAPIFNVLGSYFPSWIVCLAVGIAVTLLIHMGFVKLNIIKDLWPLPIVYPALTCLITLSLWLICFS